MRDGEKQVGAIHKGTMQLDDSALREWANKFAWDFCRNEHHWNDPCYECRCMTDALMARVIALRDAALAEQREASAGIIYDLAHSMAERGLFVRDDFGEPDIHAIQEIEAVIRSGR